VHKIIISTVKRVQFVSVRMSYITVRGCWCHVIFLNVHAITENKIYVVKDIYKELQCVPNKFPKYIMKNL
jgi:hypothetical protein